MNLYTSFCLRKQVIDLYHDYLQHQNPVARKPVDVTYAELVDELLAHGVLAGVSLDFTMASKTNIAYYPVVEYRNGTGIDSETFIEGYLNPRDAMDESLLKAFRLLLQHIL